MKLFGFEFNKKQQIDNSAQTQLRLPIEESDGTTVVSSSGSSFAYSMGIDPTWKTEAEMIQYYRDMAQTHTVDKAIDEIVSDAIVTDGSQPVKIDFEDDSKISDKIKDRISEEFDGVLKLLDFRNEGHVQFRDWYVDSRIAYYKVVDPDNTKLGIQSLQKLDVISLKKVKEVATKKNDRDVDVIVGENDYFVYSSSIDNPYSNNQIVKKEMRINPEAIAYCTSGLVDKRKNWVQSYLHKAIRPYNHLRLLEDASLIYKLVRAPQRRVFYIDVGNLPRARAEEYMRDIMNQYRNKITYNATTGDVQDDRRAMAMLEDYWLARKDGGRGTEIQNLTGDVNQTIDDLEYFKKNLYDALNIPLGRLEPNVGFSLGRASEITRDELRMSSNVNKLRNRFSGIFSDILRTQLILKGVIAAQEWEDISHDIQFVFESNVLFAEMKSSEILQQRLGNLGNIENYIGKYFSQRWVQKNVLYLTDEEIDRQREEIEEEIKLGYYKDPRVTDDQSPSEQPSSDDTEQSDDETEPK